MKKAVIITSIITLVSLLLVIGFATGIAVSGVKIIANTDYTELPDIAEGVIDIFEDLVPGIDIDERMRNEFLDNVGEIGDNISAGNINDVVWDFIDEEDYGEVFYEEAFSAEEIKKIDIKLTAGNIKAVRADGSDISVKAMLKRPTPFVSCKADAQGGVLKVRADINFEINTDATKNNGIMVVIAVPEKNFESIKADIEAGNIMFTELSSDSISVNMEAGSISFEDVSGGAFEIDNEAGNICVKNTSGESFTADTEAGNIEIGENSRFAQNVSLKAECGNIHLSLPDDMGYTLSYKMGLGKVQNDLSADVLTEEDKAAGGAGTVVNGSGKLKIDIKTELGNITLENE